MAAFKEYLGWVNVILKSTRKERAEWVKIIMDGLRYYRQFNHRKTDWLSDQLENKADYELIGFVPNLSYIKHDAKDAGLLNAIFVHPWGVPSLLYKHKRLPIAVIVNPAMRLDDTVLNEQKNPREDDLMGFTG